MLMDISHLLTPPSPADANSNWGRACRRLKESEKGFLLYFTSCTHMRLDLFLRRDTTHYPMRHGDTHWHCHAHTQTLRRHMRQDSFIRRDTTILVLSPIKQKLLLKHRHASSPQSRKYPTAIPHGIIPWPRLKPRVSPHSSWVEDLITIILIQGFSKHDQPPPLSLCSKPPPRILRIFARSTCRRTDSWLHGSRIQYHTMTCPFFFLCLGEIPDLVQDLRKYTLNVTRPRSCVVEYVCVYVFVYVRIICVYWCVYIYSLLHFECHLTWILILNLLSFFCNGTRQKRPRELDHQLRWEDAEMTLSCIWSEMTLQMQEALHPLRRQKRTAWISVRTRGHLRSWQGNLLI